MKEELPESDEGETEGNLRIADRPKVQRLPNREKTLLMNCGRPLYMEEWGEMTRARQRGALENVGMAYYLEETTPEVSGEKGVNTAVSSKQAPPKEPITFWQYPSEETPQRPGGKDSEGSVSIGKDNKGKDGHGEDSKGRIPK